MPEAINNQIEAIANSPNDAQEKRSYRPDEADQRQDERLHEQSFEARESANPQASEQKRKRVEISL